MHFCLFIMYDFIDVFYNRRKLSQSEKLFCTTVCTKMVPAEEKIMIFVKNVCVFDIISKRNNCSFCCILNHIICCCRSRVMPRFVRRGKIPFVPLFCIHQIKLIIRKVSTTKKLIICDERNYRIIVFITE